MANDGKITCTCPNCGSTATYTTMTKTGNGADTNLCRACRKNFGLNSGMGILLAWYPINCG